MKVRSIHPVLLLALLAAACGCRSNDQEPPSLRPQELTPSEDQELEPVAFEVVDQGDQAGLSGPVATVLRTPAAWSDVWGSRARTRVGEVRQPEVDWSREMLALVAIGERSSAGYGVEVLGVERAGGFLRVRVSERRPPPDSMQAQVMTHPYVVLRLPSFGGPVVFVIE